MHLDALIFPLILFGLLGVIMPLILSGVADKGRSEEYVAPPEKTLYEQLGGSAAVNAAVDIFYRRVLSDAYV